MVAILNIPGKVDCNAPRFIGLSSSEYAFQQPKLACSSSSIVPSAPCSQVVDVLQDALEYEPIPDRNLHDVYGEPRAKARPMIPTLT